MLWPAPAFLRGRRLGGPVGLLGGYAGDAPGRVVGHLDFHVSHYRRIRDIAALTAVVIGGAVLLLMFLSFPLGEADVDLGWYRIVYYALLLCGAVDPITNDLVVAVESELLQDV